MKVTYRTVGKAVYRIPDPDPESKMYRMVLYVAAKDLPDGLPSHGNPRKPNVERRLYSKVEASFLDPENKLFLYQNRGITVVAESVTVSGDQSEVVVEISDDPSDKGGVIDGRHTETLLLGSDNREGIRHQRPNQPIAVTILYGIEKKDRTGVTVALNSTIPVSALSNLNAQGFFESMKSALSGSRVLDRVQFEQNGVGEKEASVAHLIETMYVLRLDLFQGNLEDVSDRGKHPSYVVTATKQKIHEAFPRDQLHYEQMYPVLKDICSLHDLMEGKSHALYAKQKRSSKAFQKGHYETTWLGRETDYRLHRNATLPMLSAFRHVLEIDSKTGLYRWKLPFRQVVALFGYLAGSWVNRITKNLGDVIEEGTNIVLIAKLAEFAKDRDEWTRMYDDVELFLLKSRELLDKPFDVKVLPQLD